VEVEKTLAHSNGLRGAELLWDCALLPCVLNVSVDEAAAGLASLRWMESSADASESRWDAFSRVFPSLQRHGHSAMLLRIALLMLPVRGERLPKPTKPDTHTIARVEFSLMWDRMKMRGRDSDTVVMAHACALESFEPLLVAMAGADEASLTYEPCSMLDGSPGVGPVGRVELGLRMKRAGANYPLAVRYNVANSYSLTHSLTLLLVRLLSQVLCAAAAARETVPDIETAVARLMSAKDVMGLEGVWDAPPLWNGNALKKALPEALMPVGGAFGRLMFKQLVWTLANPTGTLYVMVVK
jgi:hypothetical protein